MKISTSLDILVKNGLEYAVKLVADAGFDCCDMGFPHLNQDDLMEVDTLRGQFAELKTFAEGCGITFNQTHAPFHSSTGDPEVDAQIFNRIKNSFYLSAELGASYVVVHPKQHITYRYNEALLKQMNFEFYKALEPYAKDAGVKIAIENMWRYHRLPNHIDLSTCSTVEEHIEYVDMLDSPVFVACLDIGHAALVGEDVGHSIRALGHDRLHTLHVHDVDLVHDNHTLPGLEKVDYKAVMKALRDIDYDGEFTLEAGGFPNKFEPEFQPEAYAFMAKRSRFLTTMKLD